MRRLIRGANGLLLVAWAACAMAQGGGSEAMQRERLARERAEAEAGYEARESACRERFIVTACIDRARAERRERLDVLRRQEEVLDGQERRRRAAARLASIREKTEALERPRTPRPAAPATAPAPDQRQGTAAATVTPTTGNRVPSVPTQDAEAARRAAEAAAAAAARRTQRIEAERRRSAVDQAAAQRAAAARQRRQEAAESQRKRSESPAQDKQAAPLPPRPAMPSATAP